MPGSLLERDDELAALDEALSAAAAGTGALVVVEAAAGMGKTRLMDAAAGAARERRMATLVACGEELEEAFAFGVVRQLLDPPLMRMRSSERDELLSGPAQPARALLLGGGGSPEPVSETAIDHALYWLVAGLALRGPLALLVDDAQWADRASLRALLHLAARLNGLPAAILVATRPPEPAAESDLLERLLAHRRGLQLRPRPLTAPAVGTLVGERLAGAEETFSRACHAASAGNPFLICELIAAVAAAEVSPTASNASRVRAIGPQTVARSVLLRLRGQPPDVEASARALAILGGRAPLMQVARVADISEQAAGQAADALAAIDVLAAGRPLQFAHPIVRAAVYESLAVSQRSASHLRVARMLHGDGAAPESVAAHLLHAEPAGDGWVVDRLREAAASATAVGAMDSAVTYLERALGEPAPAGLRPELLVALSEGYRHRHAWEPAASALRDAIALASDAARRVDAARRLSTLLLVSRRHDEASAVLATLAAELREGEPGLAFELELTRSTSMWLDTDEAPLLATVMRDLPAPDGGGGRLERVVLSRRAWAALVAGEPASEVATLARGALSSGELIAEDARAHGFEMSVVALALAGELTEARAQLARAMGDATARGHVGRWGLLSSVAAHLCLLQGQLADAEQHALQTLDALRADGIAFPVALDALVDVLLERGDVAAARHLYEHLPDDAARPDPMLLAGLRLAPARAAIAAGDLPLGLDALLRIGERQVQLGRTNPAWCAWRSAAALVHVQLGDCDGAAALADEELELARAFGSQRAIGIALRAVGICRGGAEGLACLREAGASLEASGAELEHARALVDLGAMTRRMGERGEPAREPLRHGREIAERLGADALAERAREELLSAGARPRRTALQGVAALTPAELRVCQLAIGGLSNRDLSRALFVTVKTVEGHLASSYRKLGITRKHELAAAMAGDE